MHGKCIGNASYTGLRARKFFFKSGSFFIWMRNENTYLGLSGGPCEKYLFGLLRPALRKKLIWAPRAGPAKKNLFGPRGWALHKKILIWPLRPALRKKYLFGRWGQPGLRQKILPRPLRRPIFRLQNPYKMKQNGRLRHLPRKIITWPSPAAKKYLFGLLGLGLRKNTYLGPSGRPCEKKLIWAPRVGPA